MPNWCENSLKIKANTIKGKMELAELKEKGKSEDEILSLDNFIPMNKALEENGDECYDWQLNNWGVKGGLSNVELRIDTRDTLKYYFETPWGPPLLAFLTISQMFPHLTFYLKYNEPGMVFAGKVKFKNGIIIKDLNYMKVKI